MEQKWNFEELQDIQKYMERNNYGHAHKLIIYELYNRVFNQQKSPTSCGKCIVNVLNALRTKYNEERTKQSE